MNITTFPPVSADKVPTSQVCPCDPFPPPYVPPHPPNKLTQKNWICCEEDVKKDPPLPPERDSPFSWLLGGGGGGGEVTGLDLS